MIGNFGVVVDQPVGQFAVESGQVGEQQIFVVIGEVFLGGAIESLVVCVHF